MKNTRVYIFSDDLLIKNVECNFNCRLQNGHEVSQRGIEDELERLVRDVAEHSSPVQTDKQRWLREKQDIMRVTIRYYLDYSYQFI